MTMAECQALEEAEWEEERKEKEVLFMKVEQECIEEVDEGELLVLRRALCKGPNLLTYLLTCVSRINARSSNV